MSSEQNTRGRATHEAVETLHRCPCSVTRRVRERATGQTSLLWVSLDEEAPESLEEELAILQALGRRCRYVRPETMGLEGFHGVLSEDPGGRPLTKLIPPEGMAPDLALRAALALARLVQSLHALGYVHKGVAGPSLLVNEETGQAELLCHCLATRVPRETGEFVHPGAMEASLAYVSPEQTGRMNRAVDLRTDLYSLGVLLYQLLVGDLPFSADDPVGLVHAHIARAPTPPADTAAAVPRALSDLVLRLLAKNAEDRYQSAAGVIEDLRPAPGWCGGCSPSAARTWRGGGSGSPRPWARTPR